MSNKLYTPGGPVSNGIYISRKGDTKLLELCRRGEYAYVLATRQVGKSSLMFRTAKRLADEGICSAIIDLSRIGVEVTRDQWYLSILNRIAQKLIPEWDCLKTWWQENDHLGETDRLALFFEDVLLSRIKERVVIFIDEIDTTLSLAFSDDFFIAIRHLFNARPNTHNLRRLSFVLIGVATPGDLISDPNRTSFNINMSAVDLTDFTFEEALPLAEGFGLPAKEAARVLGYVLKWTQGHPFLTQRLCRAIANGGQEKWLKSDVDRLVAKTFFGENTRKDSNLTAVRDLLTKRTREPAKVLAAYRKVRRGLPAVRDEERSRVKSRLKLSGIVKAERGTLRVRNRIYRKVFNRKWIREHLGIDWLRRLGILGLALNLIFIVALLAISYSLNKTNDKLTARNTELDKQTAVIKKQNEDMEISKNELYSKNNELQAALKMARDAEKVATKSTALAKKNAEDAVRQKAIAEANASKAKDLQIKAEADSKRAYAAQKKAEIAEGALRASLAAAQASKDAAEASKNKAKEALTIAQAEQKLSKSHANADKAAQDEPNPWLKPRTQRIQWAMQAVKPLLSVGGEALPDQAGYERDRKQAISDGLEALEKALRASHLVASFKENREVTDVAFNKDGKPVTVGIDGEARVWKLPDHIDNDFVNAGVPYEKHQIKIDPENKDKKFGKITVASVSPDGEMFGVGSDHGDLRFGKIESGNEEILPEKITRHYHPINGMAFSNEIDFPKLRHGQQKGYLLANASIFWSWAVGDLRGHPKRSWRKPNLLAWPSILFGTRNNYLVNSMAFNKDGSLVAIAHEDGKTEIRDVHSGQCRLKWDSHTQAVIGVAFDPAVKPNASKPNASRLVTVSKDRTAKVWDIELGSCKAGSKQPKPASFDLSDASWNTEGGPRAHDGAVVQAAFSPDGKLIATASQDKTVKIWDAAGNDKTKPRLLLTLNGHHGHVTGLAFWDQGNQPNRTGQHLYLATISADDKTTKVWDLISADHLSELRQRIDSIKQAKDKVTNSKKIEGPLDKGLLDEIQNMIDPKSGGGKVQTGARETSSLRQP
ncbi:MAG TPA: AAA-like domain-containing protein [Blastocatellia bacterium]|nr:AAA-like domain-containing protein [Blastocatellia bacterium]